MVEQGSKEREKAEIACRNEGIVHKITKKRKMLVFTNSVHTGWFLQSLKPQSAFS